MSKYCLSQFKGKEINITADGVQYYGKVVGFEGTGDNEWVILEYTPYYEANIIHRVIRLSSVTEYEERIHYNAQLAIGVQ